MAHYTTHGSIHKAGSISVALNCNLHERIRQPASEPTRPLAALTHACTRRVGGQAALRCPLCVRYVQGRPGQHAAGVRWRGHGDRRHRIGLNRRAAARKVRACEHVRGVGQPRDPPESAHVASQPRTHTNLPARHRQAALLPRAPPHRVAAWWLHQSHLARPLQGCRATYTWVRARSGCY